ncbi:hypothetical protein CPB86DRAFT_816235 [Serendipita vermifera]|nr:hypothetical protein CPB86DRAFT_816235 [Serendipita vermifera]
MPDVLEVSTIVSSSESNTTDGNIAEDTISDSMDSVMSESPTGDPEFFSGSTSDFSSSSSYPITEDTSNFTITITVCGYFALDDMPFTNSGIITYRQSANHILGTTHSHMANSANVPMSSPSSMEAETPTPSAARTHVTTVVGGPITVTHPTHMVNTLRPFGENDPINTPGNILRSSVRVAEMGTSTTLSIATEITLGIDPWTTPETSMMSRMRPSIGSAITPGNVPNNNIVRGRLPPAAIGAIVGSLLGALTLWILLVVWLKKKKKAQSFRQLEDTRLHKSSPETNGITPFVQPAPEPHNTFNPDSKRRFMQERPRATSPVTSIGDTGIHSEFLNYQNLRGTAKGLNQEALDTKDLESLGTVAIGCRWETKTFKMVIEAVLIEAKPVDDMYGTIGAKMRFNKLAKEAAQGCSSSPGHLPKALQGPIAISASAAKQKLNKDIQTEWLKLWNNSTRFAKTSRIEPKLPSKRFIKLTRLLRRNQTAIITQFRTSHVPLNFYLARIKRSDSPMCPHCPETPEDVRHFFLELGTSTTLSIVTEITLGIDTWSTPGTSMVAGTQESFGGIGPAVTSTHVPNNDIVRGRLPPAAIGAIVGSLLGALTLWILLVVWLKKRKKAQAFQQMEDTWLHKSSPEMNRITPFVPPPPKPSNSFNPDSKRRFVQEMPRATSPVTSIGDTGIHSEFLRTAKRLSREALGARDLESLGTVAIGFLELNQNGKLVDKSNLSSRESIPGVWDADEPLILQEVIGDFTLSVLMQQDQDERQLVGSVELKETELFDMVGTQFEIPLISQDNYPDILLRTKVLTIEDLGENTREVNLGTSRQNGGSGEGNTIERMLADGVAAFHDFESDGNLESLDQAVSKFEVIAELIPEEDPKLPGILSNLGAFLLSRFERLGRIQDINNSIERLEKVKALAVDSDSDKPGYLNNLGSSLQARFERLGETADIDSAIVNQQTAVELTPDGHPDKPNRLNNLGASLQTRFERFGEIADIDSAIINQQAASELAPHGHPDKPKCLNNLGISLQTRFDWFGEIADINSAIVQKQAAVELTPDGHPSKPARLNNLGRSLQTRFELFGEITDIDSAIVNQKAALELTPEGHPSKPNRLNNLGNSLQIRFGRSGEVADIDSAIVNQQAAVELTPDGHPDKPSRLNNLGVSLESRFERFGEIADIDSAIVNKQAALELTPHGHPSRPNRLNNLGNSLRVRFGRFGEVADIDRAIVHKQAALELTPDGHPAKPTRLNNLASSLQTRFERFEEVPDLDSAIVHEQAAVELTPDSHPRKPSWLSNLGICLQTRFVLLGEVADIDSAIVNQRAAVELTPDDHPDKPTYLNNLGISLRSRFMRLGQVADINSAIVNQQAAVELTPDGHPLKSSWLNNLGCSLHTRFEWSGEIADIDNAINQCRAAVNLDPESHPKNSLPDLDSAIVHEQAAVELTPDSHPRKPSWLSNLGICLQTRFVLLGEVADIDSAIVNQRAAVELTPDDHPDKPTYLNNLGISLRSRFMRLGEVADINSAIVNQQAAVELTPDGHPLKSSWLNNLGCSLHTRFEWSGEIADIDNAINQCRAAVNLDPESHPKNSRHLRDLGNAFTARFLRLHDPEDAKTAILYLSLSTTSSIGPPATRFDAVQIWISIASLIGHDSLLSAYECAVALMPLVAWLGLSIPHRHRYLVKMGGIARDAAAAAISLEQYDKALEWLDQGRSIVWNQILQLRTPVDELRTVSPGLAERLLQVSRLLDHGVKDTVESIEQEGHSYRELTAEWESIIEQVRSLPGFEDFLKPPRLSRLINACRDAPVVVFNIAPERCDALTLVPGSNEVMHIPLPDITAEKVTELRDQFKDMLYSSGVQMRGDRATERVRADEITECRPILVELWNRLVKPVLNSLEFPANPDVLPRIWWCATGPLAFLPIHAAGIYDDQSVGSHVSDYVISSYTPTLSSLLQSAVPAMDSQFKLLSVIQPSAPGVPSIPNTKEELERIKHHIGDREHIILDGKEGTKERVMKAVKESNWVHLACHGSQRQDEPTKSGLILEDGHLTLEEIIKLNLPNAEFAFLSACQTMTGEESLSEEAVHIAGGMLLAGYRGVVATMWSIQDNLAPEVADEFYRHIMADKGRPDSTKAAEALHYSIQRLRKKGGIPLTSWIPFVHLGL